MATTIPVGMLVSCRIIRAIVSALRTKRAPINAEPGIRKAWLEPTYLLARSGAIRTTNAIMPLTETKEAVKPTANKQQVDSFSFDVYTANLSPNLS